MHKKLKTIVKKVNIIRPICNGLVGKHHKFMHRALVGLVIMICGVLIAKSIGHSPTHYIAVAGDTVGYGLHGIGLIPFVEALLEDTV